MKNLEHYMTINNKKYSYTLKKVGENATFFECQAANISQEFLNEDVPGLLTDLQNLILAELKYKGKQGQVIRFRVGEEDKKLIMKKAYSKGYKTISDFLRDLALGGT